MKAHPLADNHPVKDWKQGLRFTYDLPPSGCSYSLSIAAWIAMQYAGHTPEECNAASGETLTRHYSDWLAAGQPVPAAAPQGEGL